MGRFSYQGPLTVAGVTLGTAPQGYAIKPAAGPAVPVTYQGQMISVQALGAWQALAATPGDATPGYTVYLGNSATSQYATWTLGSSGAFESAALLSAADIFAAETRLNADLNQSGVIGG